MPTNITMLLKGLLVLDAKEGHTIGVVGILKNPPPGHVLTIKITRQPPGGGPVTMPPPPIGGTLSLNIVNAGSPNITIRNPNPVNRTVAPANQDSIKWFVDLERAGELYRFSIGANRDEFMPILTFNSGRLFAAELSENFLLVQRGIFASYEDFGRVALTLGVEFLSATSAVFKNGPDVVFDSASEPGTDYKIEITHDAAQHPPVVTDANNYYKALGAGIPLEQRILFMSLSERELLKARLKEAQLKKNKELEDAIRNLLRILGPPAGPEAACFPAYLGQTNI